MLFRYRVECSICKSHLTAMFPTLASAMRGARVHAAGYARIFDESDHNVTVYDVQERKEYKV